MQQISVLITQKNSVSLNTTVTFMTINMITIIVTMVRMAGKEQAHIVRSFSLGMPLTSGRNGARATILQLFPTHQHHHYYSHTIPFTVTTIPPMSIGHQHCYSLLFTRTHTLILLFQYNSLQPPTAPDSVAAYITQPPQAYISPFRRIFQLARMLVRITRRTLLQRHRITENNRDAE